MQVPERGGESGRRPGFVRNCYGAGTATPHILTCVSSLTWKKKSLQEGGQCSRNLKDPGCPSIAT